MNKSRLKGLGRGLDALLAANQDDEGDKGELQMLPTHALQPGKYQPRTRMDPGSLELPATPPTTAPTPVPIWVLVGLEAHPPRARAAAQKVEARTRRVFMEWFL